MKPPPAPKLLGCILNSSTMMVKTGTATFHHVMPLLTRENNRIPRKLIAVKTAISTIVMMKPVVVTLPCPVPPFAFTLNRPCQ